MFELLMQLPLFQGLSVETLSQLVEKYPFHFLKFHDGETIVDSGETVTHARFVVSGQVRLHTAFRNLQVMLSQTLSAPHVLGADWLFGMTTAHPTRACALGECGILQITKSDYVEMLQSNKVLLFNILNYLSLKGQHSASAMLNLTHGTVDERLAILIKTLTTRSSVDINLDFRQKDLCMLIGTQRNSLLNSLNKLAQEQLITFSSNSMGITNPRAFLEQVR